MRKSLSALAVSVLAISIFSPISPAFAAKSQGGEETVILNPGGGQVTDGSDGLRMVFNGKNGAEAPETGSDQLYFAGQDQWCCGGAGPVLAIGATAYGEAGAAAEKNLPSFSTVVVSGLSGAYETIVNGSAAAGVSIATGNAAVTFTYTVVLAGLTYTIVREITYVSPNNYYDEVWTVTIPAGNSDVVKLYVGGDAAPGGSDDGIGSTVVSSSLRSIREANPASAQYLAYTERNTAQKFTNYFVGRYDLPYPTIEAGGDLSDAINRVNHDAGIQVQWTFSATPGTYPRSMRTTVGFNSDLDTGVASTASTASVPGIFLNVAGHIGRTGGESPVYYGSDRVAVESTYLLTVKPVGGSSSSAVTMAEGTIDTDRSFSTMVRLPQLAPGDYEVQLTGTHNNGSVLELTCPITVSAEGRIVAIGDNVPVIR